MHMTHALEHTVTRTNSHTHTISHTHSHTHTAVATNASAATISAAPTLSSSPSMLSLEEMMTEFKRREKKKLNIVITGIPIVSGKTDVEVLTDLFNT